MPFSKGRHHGVNRTAAAAYQKGLAAFETGRFLDAIELLSNVAESNDLPATLARFYLGQAHLKQGVVELERGNHADAARHLTASRQVNPDSVGLSRYLVACHASLGRFDLAAEELESDYNDQSDEHLPIRLAHAFARDGQLHRAIETLTTAIAAAPGRSDLHFQLGVLYCTTNDYAQALSEFSIAARFDPANSTFAKHQGLAHAALGQHSEAADCLATACRIAPGDAHAALLLTLACQAIGTRSDQFARVSQPGTAIPHDDKAIVALGEVIIREPDFVEAFLNLPPADVDRDIFAMLADTLQQALERHPEYADLHYHCARVYERLGKRDEAIGEARAAVGINPRYVQALITLGRLYGQTELTGEAIERLEQAVAAGGDYPDVHFMLGQLYRGQGKRMDAEGEFRRALELNSNYAAARAALAEVAIA